MLHLAPVRRVVAPCALWSAAVLATACASGDDAAIARWETVTDTVGDTVVVRTVGATDSTALARLVPELSIGELDGDEEYQFASVGSILPAPDNGVYVWDQTLLQLRQYDSTGTFVRRIGGKGGGPGEYEAANGIVRLGDGRLVLWDPRNTRLNVYDATGAHVATWRFASGLHVGGTAGLLVDAADNVYALHWFRPTDTTRRAVPGERTGYMVLGPDGAIRDSLLPPPAGVAPARLVASREGSMAAYGVPFAPQRAWTVNAQGHLVSGVGNRYAITVHRPGGPLRIERDVAPVAVDPDEKANAEEIVTYNLRRMEPSWRWNGPPVPDTKPFFDRIHAAADGRLWVERPAAGVRVEPEERSPDDDPRRPDRRWRDPTVFDVFDADGRFLGTVAVPERTSLLHMRGDHAWGVVRDSLDVPYVTRFRIEWQR